MGFCRGMAKMLELKVSTYYFSSMHLNLPPPQSLRHTTFNTNENVDKIQNLSMAKL